MSPQDDWSQLLTTDMDKLFTGREERRETITLKKGERRNVTVLFLDIKGFTAMSEKLDPEEVTMIIDNVFKVLTSEILRYGGMVDKYIGDCIMALFGAKKASEDDAERAIRAALGMLGKMSDVNRIMQPKGITLGCRIGINSGLVVAGELGDRGEKDFTVMGDTVNTASRLESNAEVNTIMVSENTREQAGDIFDYQELEPIMVKGKSKPLQVYRVRGVLKERVERWERDTLAKSKAYVGRAREWDALEAFMQGYFADGGPEKLKVAGLRADGGMGKSRMVHEFLTRGPCPRGLLIKGKTISYANAPYWVFVSVFKYLMGASEGDPVETVRAKWEKAYERLKQLPRVPEGEREAAQATLAEHEDFLAYLLGVPKNPEAIKKIKPDELKELIFTTFRLFVEAASALDGEEEAMYLVLDDLHWLDELSRELVDYLLANLRPHRPTLIVTMYRPDYQISGNWKEGDNFFQLVVEPLSLAEVKNMVQGMLKGLVLNDKLAGLIYDKSGGNPFYVEEITFSLIDREVLIQEEVQEGNPVWVVNPAELDVELPDTIHGMVQTRIDKLDEEARKLLFEASVIGMEFSTSLLGNLHGRAGGDRQQVDALLSELVAARMIGTHGAGDQGFGVFSNVLISEVSYNTLLNYNKTLLHGLLGECIEEIYGDGEVPRDEHYRLAHHYEKGDKAGKAVFYLESAADQCHRQFLTGAAIDQYARLLELLDKAGFGEDDKNDTRLRNTYKLAQVEYLANRLDDAFNHFSASSKLAQQAQNYKLLCGVLTSAGEIERIRENPDKAMKFFEKSLELAGKLNLDEQAADNLVNIGIVMEEGGDYAGAMDYFQQALARAANDEQRQNISYYIFQRG
jgi:class 3 adenylate cyclase/tetratricopeptide (TPR) repeat protein